jgi:glycosyltransferase involved in cell wall biosynthesis
VREDAGSIAPSKAATERSKPISSPLVSIIIPTKNSQATIAICLESLVRQTYGNTEIILVDNFSTDSTISIAQKRGGVKIFKFGDERSAQVNYGARMSKGDYLYRVDSDFVVEPEVVEQAVHVCLERGLDCVVIHNTSDPTISLWSAARQLERDCYVDDFSHVATTFFRRQAFESVNGYDESLIASEDYDLHNRLLEAGFRAGRIRAKEIHIGEPRKLSDVVRKHVYYGRTIGKFMQKNPKTSAVQLGPARVAYLRHWRLFFKDPKVSAAFFLYQYVRYVSASCGYAASRFGSGDRS